MLVGDTQQQLRQLSLVMTNLIRKRSRTCYFASSTSSEISPKVCMSNSVFYLQALALPVEHRPQTTLLHRALSWVALSVFFQLYLNLSLFFPSPDLLSVYFWSPYSSLLSISAPDWQCMFPCPIMLFTPFVIVMYCVVNSDFCESHYGCWILAEILLGWLNNSTEYDVLDFFSILEWVLRILLAICIFFSLTFAGSIVVISFGMKR